jgi:hypothetical protein
MRAASFAVVLSAVVFACGGSSSDTAPPAGDDEGPPNGNCSGPSGANHRAQGATCASNAGADAGCDVQPKDQCLTDSDCGPAADCECETPIPAGQVCPGGVSLPSGNACIPSNCRVDSDCAPCGVCQGEYSCGQYTGFYCQTPEDTCVPSAGDTGYDGNGCRFVGGHWTSMGMTECPG